MSFAFRPAKRENVSLLVGVAGPSGSGKTYSAMLLARGMSAGKPFAVIDSEAGRAKHYADQFRFDHGDLEPPFTPARYLEAIIAADKAGYAAILVDSASHEHAGDGGLLDMQEAEIERLSKGNDDRRDAVKLTSWIKPKMAHKRFVQRLLQVRAHIILCFRAEAKIDIVKENGKTIVRPKQTLTSLDGWIPICEKSLPFELTCSFLLTPDQPGVPKPIKLQEQHRPYFPPGKPITEAAGVALAAWAAGGVAQANQQPVASSSNGAEKFIGICGTVHSREERNVTIYDVPVGGTIFSTVDKAIADRAGELGGVRVVITAETTKKGGRKLTSIEDEEAA